MRLPEYPVGSASKRVLFITIYPSPYRVDLFNELGSRDGIELTVAFLERIDEQKHRSGAWFREDYTGFTAVFQKRIIRMPGGVCVCPEIFGLIRAGYDIVIFGGVSYPTAMLAMEYMRLRGIPYWLEGDGAIAKDGRGLKERVKRHFVSGAELAFSTGRMLDEYYLRYGVRPSAIVRYPFSSLRAGDILPAPLTGDEKRALRGRLGLTEDRIVVSVGRFTYQGGYGKGYDVLLDACGRLPEDVGVYIIGDEPTEAFVRMREERQLKQLHFLGFMGKEELFEYYRAADVFALLSRGEAWGLVVNEAMANALPVITTDRCVAGLELVRNGENGYIVPAGDAEASAEALSKALAPGAERMGARSLEIIRDYTIEKMADRHAEVFFQPRGTTADAL